MSSTSVSELLQIITYKHEAYHSIIAIVIFDIYCEPNNFFPAKDRAELVFVAVLSQEHFGSS